MKAIVVTDQAAGTAGMTLVERPEPQAAINDVVVQIHASGFVPTEMAWPSTWTDRLDRDRTPLIPGHELAGVVTALGYGTTGLSVGQRVFGLTDWYRDGTLAEYAAVEARNLAPLPGDVDFTVGASLPISGLTAWQGLFQHGRLQAGQSVLAHGAAGAVGSMVTQLAREAGAYVIGTGRAADRQTALDFGAQEFVDLENDALEDVGGVDLVFDVIGGDIGKRSAGLIRAGGTLVSVVGPPETRPADGLAIDFVVESDRGQLGEVVQRVRDGRLRTNIGNVATLDDAVAALNPTDGSQERRSSAFVRKDSLTDGSELSWLRRRPPSHYYEPFSELSSCFSGIEDVAAENGSVSEGDECEETDDADRVRPVAVGNSEEADAGDEGRDGDAGARTGRRLAASPVRRRLVGGRTCVAEPTGEGESEQERERGKRIAAPATTATTTATCVVWPAAACR